MVRKFITAISRPSHGHINNAMWDFYTDFTQEKFIDEIEEEEEKNPARLEATECAHYVMCFLFDLAQFIVQHFTTAKEAFGKEEDVVMIPEEATARKRAMFFDHRKPIK